MNNYISMIQAFQRFVVNKLMLKVFVSVSTCSINNHSSRLINFVMTTIHCPTVASSAVVKGSDADAVCEGNTGLCSVSSYFLHLCFFI